MDTVVKIIGSINRFFGYVIAWLGAAITAIVGYEVVARYFFHSPSMWSMEVNQYLFCGYVLLGGGYCMWRNNHVRVDLIYPKLSATKRAWIEILFGLPCALLMAAVLFWIGGQEFWSMWSDGSRSDSVIALPLWPVWSVLPLAGLLLGLQIFARYIENIKVLLDKDREADQSA